MPLGLQVRSRSVSHDSVEQFAERVRSVSADSPGQWRQLGIDEPAYVAPSEQEVKHLHKITEVSKESLMSRDSELEGASDVGKNSYSTEMHFNDSIYDLTIAYCCTMAERGADRTCMINLLTVLLLQLLNLGMQLGILLEVDALIAQPASLHVQHLYGLFTDHCYGTDLDKYIYTDEVEVNFETWDDQAKGELCAYPLTSPTFFGIILLIWTFFLMHELKATVSLAYNMLRLDRPQVNHLVVFKHNDADGTRIIEKVSMGLKACVTVVVLIPKMCIALWLWFIGARWLTSTPGIDNVVLNALALTFICDLDEVIYRTCVSEATKEALSRTTLPLPPFSHKPTLWGPAETWFTLAACVVWSFLYKDYLQSAIPNYRGDLVIVCRSAQHSMIQSRMR